MSPLRRLFLTVCAPSNEILVLLTRSVSCMFDCTVARGMATVMIISASLFLPFWKLETKWMAFGEVSSS